MNRNHDFQIKNFLLALIISALFSIPMVSVKAQNQFGGPKNDLKLTLLSLGSGSSRFTYERVLGENISAEFTVGIIGWGVDILHQASPNGILIKLAPKLNIKPSQRAHTALAGCYVKPELVYANFDYNGISGNKSNPDGQKASTADNSKVDVGASSNTRFHTQQWALMAECGYQLVSKWFVFDIYCGLGPSFGTGNQQNYFHGFMLFPAESHLAATSGFRIGVAF